MKQIVIVLLVILSFPLVACTQEQEESVSTAPAPSDAAEPTVYGFFPTPAEATTQAIFDVYENMGLHADVALFQQNFPWEEFVDGVQTESKTIIDIGHQVNLAHENGLEVFFMIDPLNGLDRSELYNLPSGWEASFGNPQVRASFTNVTLSIVREFHPSYLGLASEINTYQDKNPEDFENYMSLYLEVYDLVKAEAPDTKIFVSFQWEEMNNLIPSVARDEPYKVNWFQFEQFEPKLDLWAISSYPFIAHSSGKDIPSDYYSQLLTRTSKPIAVAEGGYTSESVLSFTGTPQDQIDYLNAIHNQLGGERLAFWIYLLLADFNVESYAEVLTQQGNTEDVPSLGIFEAVGLCEPDYTPKPALAIWDSFRNSN
jgi:hypothetical protein